MHPNLPSRHGHPAALALAAFLTLGCAIGSAQTAASEAPAGGADADADAPIVMSPFEVNTSSDVGYSASETLGGTRVRTSLRDVGTAISVYTGKFLEDTGSTNARDLLVYATNAEVGGIRGNYSATLNKGSFFDDTGSGSYVTPTGDTRLRGLSAADVTRGFFLSDIPFDSYNTDRVDIQRGANSILFGLAAPGGVLNNSLNQAQFKDGGNYAFRVDQYGSLRQSVDANLVVIPKQLALRVDLLDDQRQFEQKEAWQRDRRLYAALRYEPDFLNQSGITTSFRASIEHGTIGGDDPVVLPPRDQMTTWWSEANKQAIVPAGSFNPVTGVYEGYTNAALNYNDAGNYVVDATGSVVANPAGGFPWIGDPGRWYQNIAAVYLQPDSSIQGGGTAPAWMQRVAIPTLPGENWGWYNNFAGLKTGSGIFGTKYAQQGFWKDPVINDPSIFDFYHHLLAGPNKFNGQDFTAFTASLSQTFLDNQIGYEFAFDHQQVDARQENAFAWEDGNAINLDINKTLPDGTPNPNFGRPYVASDFVDNFLDFRTRQSMRATAFYDLDFKRHLGDSPLAKILGRHVFTGLWTTQGDNHKSLRYTRSAIAGDTMQFINQPGQPWNWENTAAIHYLGDSLAGAASPVNAHLSGITADQIPDNGYTGTIYDPNTHSFVNHAIGVINDPYYSTFGPGWTKQVVDSSALVWQGHLLDDVIVPTIGWRHDRAKVYQANNPPNNAATGYAIVDDPRLWYLPTNPSNTVTGNNTSYQLVVHTPSFIKQKLPWGTQVDLTFNKSQNFSPSAAAQDIYGNPMPAQSGSTKDYGIAVTMLDDRLRFRAIRYESNAENAQVGGVNTYWVVQEEINFWNAAHNPYNIANHPDAVAAYNAHQVSDALKSAWNWQVTTNPINGVQSATGGRPSGYINGLADTTSKGYEFEIGATPVTGWDIMFNASKTEAQSANNMKDLLAYMNDRIPVWTGTAGDMVLGQGSTTTLAQDATNNIIISYETALAKNGQAQQELHKWHWNLINNYTFRTGVLKGLNIGGAVRWQDRIAIGYGVKTNDLGALIYDLDHPFYGSSETNVDLWIGYEHKLTSKVKWKIQLNARDLFQGNKLIPIAAQPDGSIATYRIAPETQYSLTNTFSF